MRKLFIFLLLSCGLYGLQEIFLCFRGSVCQSLKLWDQPWQNRGYFLAASSVVSPSSRVGVMGVRWKCPKGGHLKLNTDDLMRVGSGASMGGVLRESEGRVVWCFCERCPVTDVALSEAMTI